jgi:hypothetical protein
VLFVEVINVMPVIDHSVNHGVNGHHGRNARAIAEDAAARIDFVFSRGCTGRASRQRQSPRDERTRKHGSRSQSQAESLAT